MSSPLVIGLQRLLKPRHIAVAGGRIARIVMRECARVGYQGSIWPIHPNESEIEGRRAFRSVSDLPEAPDAAFIAAPAEPTIGIVADLAKAGAGAAVCYAAGFAEIGGEGSLRQQRLIEAAGSMPVVGPNCYGVLNLLEGCVLWPDTHGAKRVDRGVAILTQSGNIALNVTMQRRGLPIAYVIAAGNMAVGAQGHYLEALLDDDRVTAIGLHIEALDDIALFSEMAIRALERRVPIVVLKTGRSALGAAMTMSHTSSLAGPDELYGALFERYGIARVSDIGGFVETLKLMHVTGGLPGNRIASMSCSGGEAALVADLGEDRGLLFPSFSETARLQLVSTLTEKVPVANPLDYHTYIWGNREASEAIFTTVLADSFDMSILVLDQPRLDRGAVVDQGFDAARMALVSASVRTGARAAVLASLPESMPEAEADALLASGVVPLQGVGDGLDAIANAVAVGAVQARRRQLQPIAAVPMLDGNPTLLDEHAAKRLLSRHGVPVPQGYIVRPFEAAAAAASIGFPVALKVVSETIAHKSDVGGVKLALRSRAEVMQAVEGMAHLSDRFLVERMISGTVAELIVGVVRDPQFGLTLTIGAGGILVELVKDSATMLLPVSANEVETRLLALRVSKLLTGYRGRPRGDVRGAVKAILSIAAFAEAHADSLVELDVNPLFILGEGHGAIAADALLRMRQ